MGRQAYMTRLALGRSAFQPPEETQWTENADRTHARVSSHEENGNLVTIPGYVQQYDRRGHPENLESRTLLRQSRRAQNDVLATVGVCVGVDENGKAVQPQVNRRNSDSNDTSKVQLVMRENELGLLLVGADTGLFFLGTFWVLGLRQRLQTFRFYAGVPLASTIKSESKHFGLSQFLYGGMTARLSYLIFDIALSFGIKWIQNTLLRNIEEIRRSRRSWRRIMLGVDLMDRFLAFAAFAAIVPMEVFATLQQLDLIPQWPILPHARAFIPFTRFSPFQAPTLPADLTLGSSLNFLSSLSFSPLTVWWTLYYGKPLVERKLHTYIRCILPKPSNSDEYSIMGAMEDELDDGSIPGIETLRGEYIVDHRPPRTFLEEVKKDLQSLSDRIRGYLATWKRPKEKSAMISNFRENLTTQSVDSIHDSTTETPIPPTSADSHTENNPPSEDTAEEDEPLPQIHPTSPINTHPNRLPPLRIPSSSPFLPGTSNSSPASQTPSTSSPPSPTTPALHVSTEIIPTNSSTADILQLNVQMHPQNPTSQDSPTITNAFTSTAAAATSTHHPIIIDDSFGMLDPAPKHRVTTLTAYPYDALASHLAAHLTTLIFLPLEALFVRSVTLGYLSSPVHAHGISSGARERLRREVYPLGSWFGAGLRGGGGGVGGGVADYVGKMVLVAGLEVGVGFAVWQFGVGVAWWVGGRWFRWGRF